VLPRRCCIVASNTSGGELQLELLSCPPLDSGF
jgi:hypothetical protein